MIGVDKDIILQAVSLLEHVDKEDHARTLETLIHKYNENDDNYELLDSIECEEFKKELTDIDLYTCTISNQSFFLYGHPFYKNCLLYFRISFCHWRFIT